MKLKDIQLECNYLEHDKLFYDLVRPMPLKEAHLISANEALGKELGLTDLSRDEMLVAVMNGEAFLQGSEPFAMCYAGHQFGYYVPRLGDGRAINLGSFKGWHFQLKGAGKTLYSRSGDGRAVLRSSIREYLMSEAMYGLGIATTRALALIGSDEDVAREQWEKGAVVLRLSPTWIRFGTFEYFYYRRKYQHLEALLDRAIAEAYPHLIGVEDAYGKMFEAVVVNTAEMIAQWQSVGFNHGVMNTDNMSIAGITIDYGPYAFLDAYHADYICNHTDQEGRYSFSNQPHVALWNLTMLAKTLTPLITEARLDEALKAYSPAYSEKYAQLMRAKLGLEKAEADDMALLRWLLSTMQQNGIDYSYFFRTLSAYTGDRKAILELFSSQSAILEWLDAYDKRLLRETQTLKARQEKMRAVNPKYVLRNALLQQAIEKAQAGDYKMVDELLVLAHDPFSEHPEFEAYSLPPENSMQNLQLSCSS